MATAKELEQKVDRLSGLVEEMLEQNRRIVEQNETLMDQMESFDRDQYFNARRDSEIGEHYVKLCALILATYSLIETNVTKKQVVLCTHSDIMS